VVNKPKLFEENFAIDFRLARLFNDKKEGAVDAIKPGVFPGTVL
jgi:hypothetical protein